EGESAEAWRARHKRVGTITVLGKGREQALRAAVERGCILAKATNLARDLGNEPPNVLTPRELAARACAMAEVVGLECEIFDERRIEEMGMGALLGVARGSAEPPRLIVLRYRGAPDDASGLGLV